MIVVAFAISLSFTLSSQSAFAASINIDNYSFEDPVLLDGGFTTSSTTPPGIPDWDGIGSDGKTLISGSTGVFDPSQTVNGAPDYTSESIIPDGFNVAYSGGGYFCQDLSDTSGASVTLQTNTIYTLDVEVGQRDDIGLGAYAIHFRAFDTASQETLAGVDTKGVQDSEGNTWPIPTTPLSDSFVPNTVTYETGNSHPRAGDQLRICVIVGSGGQTNFDNVRLDASPSGVDPTNTIHISAIGGELIPLDTTMVLVAGSQNTVAWMIPVIVSAIGIGIVIARKF
jgi:hypothetical protein